MSFDDLRADARTLYETQFGTAPQTSVFAPGRVNLLGEHTDYNGGLVLPFPLPLGTAIAIGTGGPAGQIEARSDFQDNVATRHIADPTQSDWSDYIVGAVAQFLSGTPHPEGIRIAIATNLPIGSGLSSSAALIVATMRAMMALTGREMDPISIAKSARAVENDYIGLPCGIMDQFAVSVGTPGHALYLDTATLGYDSVPLPTSHRFAVVHSGSGHKLTDDGYATRVRECQAACAALGVETLSHLTKADLPRIEALDAPLLGRARHIMTENGRVRAAVGALAAGDMDALARAMDASHASQAQDFEVSTPIIDALVENARAAGAHAARLTGGGFGGSIVALVEDGKVDEWTDAVLKSSPKARVLAIC